MKLTEQELLLREGKKIAAALGKTLAPLVEVVLHDLSRPECSIVAIANNLSGRKVGDAVTEVGLARAGDPDFPEVLQNYPNQFPDGRPAKSTSIGIKDSQGHYVAALCLNMDIGMLGAAAASMAQLAETQTTVTGIKESLAPRPLATVRQALQHYASAHNTTPRALSRAQRAEAMRILAEQGLLDFKNALPEAARVLGVARSTIYTYLPKEKA